MFCPICGKDCKENEAFCENCGNPLHRVPPVQPPQYQPEVVPTAPQFQGEVPGKTMGIVGMVLGIVSILFGCCIFYLAIPCGIAGIILSAIAMKKAKEVRGKNNFALAGLICSIVGLVLALMGLVFVVMLGILESDAFF